MDAAQAAAAQARIAQLEQQLANGPLAQIAEALQGMPTGGDPAARQVRRFEDQFFKNMDHVPKFKGGQQNFREFKAEFVTWMTSKGMWADQDLDYIAALGQVHVNRTKSLAVLCFQSKAAIRSRSIGTETAVFINAPNVKAYWTQYVVPLFEPMSDTLSARNDFQVYTQGATEDILTYATQKVALWDTAYAEEGDRSFDNLKRLFIQGIYNKEVARKVLQKLPANPQQLIEMAAEQVALEREAVSLKCAKSTNMDGLATSVSSILSHRKGRGDERMDLSTLDEKKSECLWCGRKGHWVKECRDKARGLPKKAKKGKTGNKNDSKDKKDLCSYCQKGPHKRADCRKRLADEAEKKKKPRNGKKQGHNQLDEEGSDTDEWEIDTKTGQGEENNSLDAKPLGFRLKRA